ncbi:hypothetical protein E4U43_001970, partial [Claviceps pusilla]
MRLPTLRQAAVTTLEWLGASSTAQNSDEQCVPADAMPSSHDALPQEGVVEWHPVNVTVQQLVQASLASRHDVEKERLLFVMSRQHGTWSPNHPRYRLLDALHGFSKYDERQQAGVDRLRDLYALMPKAQKKFLEDHLSYSNKFQEIEQKLARNQHLCDAIVQASLQFYNIGMHELQKHIRDREAEGRRADKTCIAHSLKHIVRDWTEEGFCERDRPFSCLRTTLEQLFPDRDVQSQDVKILLPGAGLGRLGHEISRLG